MLHPPPHREVVDALLDGAGDEVQPHRRLVLLADAVDAGNGLQLEGRVQQRLAQEHVAGVDEVEAARVRAGVEEEAFHGRVGFEACDAAGLVDGGVADAEAAKGVVEDSEKVAVSSMLAYMHGMMGVDEVWGGRLL